MSIPAPFEQYEGEVLPEWIDANGNCPTCDDYERRFARLISIFKSQSKKSQRKERNET